MAHRSDPLKFNLPETGRGLSLLPFLAVLALLEWGWLVWWLNAPLPNAWNNTWKKTLTRGQLLWRALPEVVPGVRFEESHLGMALEELSHFQNVPERIPIVVTAGLVAAAAVGLGSFVLRALRVSGRMTAWERVSLAYGLGTAGLGIVTLIVGRLGLLAPWLFRVGLLMLLALSLAFVIWNRWRRTGSRGSESRLPTDSDPPSRLYRVGFALVAGPFLLVMALASMLPTLEYDSIEYHLEAPKEYFLAGRISFLEHNVYASMPFNVEMLHLVGMELMGDWWWGALVGQLLVAGFAPAAAALIYATARRLGSPRAAWVAAIVYLSTPWIYRLANFPYVEGPLCFFHAALVLGFLFAWSTEPGERRPFWGLIGLLAGAAMACKYTGLVTAVVPFGILAVVDSARKRMPSLVLAFGIGVAAIVGPWLIKNLIDTGNPVYPLAYRIFGGRHWDPTRDAKWVNVHGPKPVSAGVLWNSLVDVAGRSDWQSPLYLALAPLALLRRSSRRPAIALWCYAAYLFAVWFLLTHRLDRFWLPLLPTAAVLAGLGADWIRNRAWTALLWFLMAVSVTTNLVYVSTALAGFNQWTGNLLTLRDRVPLDLNPALARLDAELPPGSKVLLVGQAAVFHMQHPVLYNTVFNTDILESIARGRSPEETHRDLRQMGVDYVYVDWNEIARFRSPGNYGFTDFIQPRVFDRLVRSGVLQPVGKLGLQQDLYRVRPIP